jgi:hypothetical protein
MWSRNLPTQALIGCFSMLSCCVLEWHLQHCQQQQQLLIVLIVLIVLQAFRRSGVVEAGGSLQRPWIHAGVVLRLCVGLHSGHWTWEGNHSESGVATREGLRKCCQQMGRRGPAS